MRAGAVLIGFLTLVVSARLGAQSIRGTVVDEESKLPIASVLVTMIDDAGRETLPGARSDSLGNFVVHAARAGTWRVKGMRIGYSPVTSEPVSLIVGGLAVVRLRMTTVAQRLVPVQVLERRQLSANELMSTSGFDLRERRGLGRFLSGERLAAMGSDGVREILGNQFQPALYVDNDPVVGEVLRMRQGSAACSPEIYLDGRLLATAPKPRAVVDGPAPRTALDSIRAQMRVESDQARVAADQVYALSRLASIGANELHGIEVYRSYEVPPVSLGAWFGMTKSSIQSCGTVAVWTKAGGQSLTTARSMAIPGKAIQVIMGTLVDLDTGLPLAGRPVSLLSEGREVMGRPVVTDEGGEFTVRTGRAGELRLSAGGDGYLTSTTPAFQVSANELVLVRLFVSAKAGVLAPLGVSARVSPQQIGVTSLSGFTYRRERAQGGTFFRAGDIERSAAHSIAELVRAVEGISVTDVPAANTIVMAEPGEARCAPAYYIDGARLGASPQATIAALPLDRVFGVEVYVRASEIPNVFAEGGECGVIVIWTKKG